MTWEDGQGSRWGMATRSQAVIPVGHSRGVERVDIEGRWEREIKSLG